MLPVSREEHPNDVVVIIMTSCVCASDLQAHEGWTAAEPDIVIRHENMGIVSEIDEAVSEAVPRRRGGEASGAVGGPQRAETARERSVGIITVPGGRSAGVELFQKPTVSSTDISASPDETEGSGIRFEGGGFRLSQVERPSDGPRPADGGPGRYRRG
jgi:hypothetical protein